MFKREIDIEIVVCFIGTCLLNVLGNQRCNLESWANGPVSSNIYVEFGYTIQKSKINGKHITFEPLGIMEMLVGTFFGTLD